MKLNRNEEGSMLKQVSAPDHVIALSLDGKLTGEGIQNYQSIFEEKLKQHAQVGIYVDLTTFSDMSANALIEGAKADMELFSHLNQLSRCAFVSDKEWPQTVVSFAQQLRSEERRVGKECRCRWSPQP